YFQKKPHKKTEGSTVRMEEETRKVGEPRKIRTKITSVNGRVSFGIDKTQIKTSLSKIWMSHLKITGEFSLS
ncbi:hypothetical protein QMK38_19945, partial [Lysinibacillus fusiformis]|nr:hypothetical protein [Lysinibacillus fusiformis]